MEVPAVAQSELAAPVSGESSATVRERVSLARQRQLQRQQTENARLSTRQLDSFAVLEPAASKLLETAMARLDLSARAYHRILRVARTIADLAGSENIATGHLAEAIQYRRGL